MYVPPISSPYVGDTPSLFALATQLARRAAKSHEGEVIICLDANSRIITAELIGVVRARRYTLDGVTYSNSASFLKFLDNIRMTPINGRSIFNIAGTTSRAVTQKQTHGTSEVDFILAPLHWDDKRFRPCSMVAWDLIPMWSSHRPLLNSINLIPASQMVAETPLPPPPRWLKPRYGDPLWSRVARTVSDNLGGNSVDAVTIRNDGASASDALRALSNVLEASLDATIPAHASSKGINSEQRHASARSMRSRIREAGLSRKSNLPRDIVNLIESSRAAKKEAKRNARNQTLADDAKAALADEAKVAQRRVSHAIRSHRRRHEDDWRRELHKLRTADAHAFYEDITKRLAPKDPTLFNPGKQPIPDEPGFERAAVRFSTFFKEQFSVDAPLPPGATDPAWINLLPVHDEPRLGRPFTSDDFLPIMYPYHTRGALECAATGQFEHQCPICTDTEQRRAASLGRFDLLHDPPFSGAMGLNAGAACNGELNGKHFRWPHDEGNSEVTRRFRIDITTALASTLNRALEERRMPEEAVQTLVTYILKNAKPNIDVNKCDPDFYRPIAMSKAITKMWSLAILNRLSHWTRTHNIVETANQGAFTAGVGGIWHGWTMRELIKHQWSRHKDVYVTYFDLSKAYDRVNQKALCVMLRRLGVPDNIVDLILSWTSTRTSTVAVNGVSSDPVHVSLGVGQGETTSPLFFDIFISLLARYLSTLPGVQGVESAGCRLKIVMFADDLVTPTSAPKDVQAVVTAVSEWANAWGMTINTKDGKTESMAFYHPFSLRKKEALPVITVTDAAGVTTVVKWTTSYKYLGLPMTPALSNTDLVEPLRGKMMDAYGRLFGHCKLTRRLDMQSMVQIFKTFVIGSVNYTLPLIDITSEAKDKIKYTINRFARSFLGVHESSPLALLAIEGGVPTAHVLLTRARVTLYLTLESSPIGDAPAVALFHAISSVPQRATSGKVSSWVHNVAKMIADNAVTLGAPPPVPPDLYSIKSTSTAYARLVDYLRLRQKSLEKGYDLRAAPSLDAPRAAPPTQHLLDLAFGLSQAGQLGLCGPATPLSVWGPGCSGALLHKTTDASLVPVIVPTLAKARLGVAGMTVAPVAPKAWIRPPGSSDKEYAEDRPGKPCPACGTGHIASPWHIINVCKHAKVAAARAELRENADAFVRRLAQLCADAARAGHPLYSLETEAASALVQQAVFDWNSPSGDFLLFRLCLVLPYPACVVPPNERCDDNITWLLGRVFNTVFVRPHAMRITANAWVRWGGKSYLAIAKVWADAVDDALSSAC